MQRYGRLTTICAAAVLALGLAACGSSSDDDTTEAPTAMEPMEPTPAEQIAELQAEINELRAELGLDPIDIDNLTGSVASLTQQVADLQKQVDDAADADAKAAAAAAAKDAQALFDGIDESSTDLTVSVSAVADRHGGGMASVTASGLTPGVGADDVTKSAEPMLGMWQGTMLTDTNDADASSTVVVYTDIEAPKPVAFSDVYELDGNGNLVNATVIAAANRPKVKAPEFVHTGRRNHDPDSDAADDVARIRGTFNGASGEYRCLAASATACASHDAGNGIVRLEGAWIFDPDSGAMAMQADAAYAYFGWWLNKGTTEGVEAGVFSGVTGTTGDSAAITSIDALGGTATYRGAAAGKYAINPSLSSASGGHWTADATLTAEWGAEDTPGMISGMVDNFMAGGETKDWSIKLGKTALATTGTFNSATGDPATGDGVVWTIDGVDGREAGAWSGSLHGADDNTVPTVARGQFSATHGAAADGDVVGHMVGAFGAHLEE